METLDTIYSRRSVRSFSTSKLPEQVIENILLAGQCAPSWQNRQCWHFIVVTDASTIKTLALRSGLISKANFFIKDAPVVIVACADPHHSGHLNKQEYYLVDTAIAFQQMMLAAWDQGVGSCWLGSFNESILRTILSIPEHIKIVALSPFGYPLDREKFYGKAVKFFAKSKQRKPLEKIIHKGKW